MKATWSIAALSIVTALFPAARPMQGQTKDGACKLEISEPQPAARVAADGMVSGTAVLPPGTYLWVFAHKKGLGVWWPQGGSATTVDENGKWMALVTYGIDRDSGSGFEVTARIVDSQANKRLNDWFRRTEQTGTYPGMPLPAFVAACSAPPMVSVLKTE